MPACLHDFQISQNEKYALIFGHEINGVEQEVVDFVMELLKFRSMAPSIRSILQ